MFEGFSKPLLPTRYAVRQLVAQGIERERIRHFNDGPITASAKKRKAAEDSHGGQPAQKFARKTVKTTVVRDFFGRIISTCTSENQQSKTLSNSIQEATVWIKFREGYSNAIRKRNDI